MSRFDRVELFPKLLKDLISPTSSSGKQLNTARLFETARRGLTFDRIKVSPHTAELISRRH